VATLFTHHYVTTNGVRDVVLRLSRPLKHIHLGSNIVSVERDPFCSTISIRTSSPLSGASTIHSGFSHLILATQGNQAAQLLSTYFDSLSACVRVDQRQSEKVAKLIKCLTEFRYIRTVVINHTDSSLLPAIANDQRDLNLVYSPATLESIERCKLCLPTSYTMATHVLTLWGGLPVMQTTNPTVSIRPEKILSIAVMERALLTVASKEALRELISLEPSRGVGSHRWTLGPLQGARDESRWDESPGIWICGSYAYGGIPLLEGCVVSATKVVEEIIRSEQAVMS